MQITTIEAHNLPDAWFQLLWAIMGTGAREYVVEKGSFEGHRRREFDYVTCHITNPGMRPIIPDIPPNLGIAPPTSMDYILTEYFPRYLMSDDVAPNEEYTYGERLLVSMDKVIQMLKRSPETNQAILQVGRPEDIDLRDPPCLRHVDIRIQDGRVHFIIYFRSWDLWSGFPANLAGLQLLKEYLAQEIGVQDGEMIVSSKGLHVYDFAFDFARSRVYK